MSFQMKLRPFCIDSKCSKSYYTDNNWLNFSIQKMMNDKPIWETLIRVPWPGSKGLSIDVVLPWDPHLRSRTGQVATWYFVEFLYLKSNIFVHSYTPLCEELLPHERCPQTWPHQDLLTCLLNGWTSTVRTYVHPSTFMRKKINLPSVSSLLDCKFSCSAFFYKVAIFGNLKKF